MLGLSRINHTANVPELVIVIGHNACADLRCQYCDVVEIDSDTSVGRVGGTVSYWGLQGTYQDMHMHLFLQVASFSFLILHTFRIPQTTSLDSQVPSCHSFNWSALSFLPTFSVLLSISTPISQSRILKHKQPPTASGILRNGERRQQSRPR
jgi:hypothetical protein